MIYSFNMQGGQELKSNAHLKRALGYIDSIQKKELSVVKSFAKPPHLVVLTYQAMLIVLAGRHQRIEVDENMRPTDLSWKACCRIMLNPGQLFTICCQTSELVGRDQKLDSALDRVAAEYFSQQGEMTPQLVLYYSKAAADFCGWMRSLVQYKNSLYAQADEQLGK